MTNTLEKFLQTLEAMHLPIFEMDEAYDNLSEEEKAAVASYSPFAGSLGTLHDDLDYWADHIRQEVAVTKGDAK